MLVAEGPQVAHSEKPLNAFETLTLAPIDKRLIVPEMLAVEEIAWVNDYHARVFDQLASLCDAATRDWLGTAIRPI